MAERKFYSNLEIARGVAALMVALFHIGLIQYQDGTTKRLIAGITTEPFTWLAQIFRILANGPGAVIFFFVLSGFVLAKMLDDDGDERPVRSTLSFLVSRLFRIYPAVASTILIFFLVYMATGRANDSTAYNVTGLLLNVSLIRTSIDYVTWSLQIEMIAVPLLLAVFFLWKRNGFKAIAISYAILLILSFTSWWNHLIGHPNQFGQIYGFIAGMATYLYGQKIVVSLRRPGIALALAILALFVTRHIVGWSSYWTFLLETTFASCVVALLAFRFPGAASTSRISALRTVGRVSFSFYLLHPLTLLFIEHETDLWRSAVEHGIHPLILATALFAVTSIATFGLAWVQFRLIEVPFVRFGKYICNGALKRPSTNQGSTTTTHSAMLVG